MIRPRTSRSRHLISLHRGRSFGAAPVASAVLAAALLATAGAARADDAETLLKDGKALMKAGKLDEACPKLEESQKDSPRAATLIEVAACHEKQGKIATAWSEYIDAEADARKEGRKPVEKDAAARSAKLEAKVPRVTITVAKDVAMDGMDIRIDGVSVPKGDWGKPRPVDPGEHKLVITAPNKKDGEQAFSIKIAERKSVAVNALVDGTPGGATPPPPHEEAKTEVKPPEKQEVKPPPEPPKPAESWRKPKRWVGEISANVGFLSGEIPRSGLPGLSTYDYEYFVKDAKYVDLCGDSNCQGVFHWAMGGYVGGEGFFGYALSDNLQIGGRFFGAARVVGYPEGGGGFVILGGPSISFRSSSKLWLGGTLVVGGVQQQTTVLGIKGSVPDESQQYNNDLDEVDVPQRKNTPTAAQAGTFSFGLALEVSYILLDHPATNWTSGALAVSAWPTFVKGLEGFAVAVPVGVGYRFY